MKNRSVENPLRWMLAAWSLLATMLGSSAFVHSHSGGDQPHRHARSAWVPNAPSHPFVPGAAQGSYEGGLCLSAADFHRHGRILLLGAIKYLPTPGEPAIPHGKSPCDWDTIIAVSAAQRTRACSNGVAVGHCELGSLADFCVGCVCPTGQQEIPALGFAQSAPLCDRARHERSGVQLA
jgi:hypothetical protein